MRVLTSPPWRTRVRNPYNNLLYRALEEQGVEVDEHPPAMPHDRTYDVWHLHWPEFTLGGPSWIRAAARGVRLLYRLRRARRRGTRVVWTIHNLAPHESRRPRLVAWFLRRLPHHVDVAIALTSAGADVARDRFPDLEGRLAVVAHGHFREVYGTPVERTAARRQLGITGAGPVICFFGQVRPYKGVPELVQAFREHGEPGARLLVAGQPLDDRFAAELRTWAEQDDRLVLHLGFVEDGAVPVVVGAADVVVLPFREVLNSSTLLLALSMDRPVVVPRTPTFAEIQHQVGAAWVHLYDGDFDAAALDAALAWAREPRPPQAPLDAYGWDAIARATLAAYTSVAGGTPLPGGRRSTTHA